MKKIIIFYFAILLSLTACFQKKTSDYSYELLPVAVDGKWGYIDQKGTFVIEPKFDLAYLFSDGLALVQNAEGKMGFIDIHGKYKIAPIYKYAANFSEALAFVTPENHIPTCIDTSGKIVFQLYNADVAESFSDGMALIILQDKYGFVNRKGEAVVEPQYESAFGFSDGLAAVAVDVGQNYRVIKWGFIDKNGKMRVAPQFDDVRPFSEEKAFVKDHHSGKWGVIDLRGNFIIAPQFDDATFFNEDMAAIKLGDSWGFINHDGKIIVNPMFRVVSPYNDGVAAVCHEPLKWNFMNKNAVFSFANQYQAVSDFFENHAFVAHNDRIGLINKKGEFVVEPQFDNAFPFYFSAEKVFLNEELFTFVYNDFFDAKLIADLFFTDIGNVSFKGLNERTTYETIIERAGYEDLEERSRYGIFSDAPITISEGEAYIVSVSFEFQTPIYKIEPEYYYGKQIGENTIALPDAQLESVEFTLQTGTKENVLEKGETLHKALLTALSECLDNPLWEEFPLEKKTIATMERLRFTIKYENQTSVILVEFINPSNLY